MKKIIKFHQDICFNCKHIKETSYKVHENSNYCNKDGRIVNEFDSCFSFEFKKGDDHNDK